MADHLLRIERSDGVLKLTLDDPETRNALGPEVVRALGTELDRFEDNPEDRVLLLTGQDPSFCSGANVRRFKQQIPNTSSVSPRPSAPSGDAWDTMDSIKDDPVKVDPDSGALLPLRIHNLRKPSIAAINGYAIGVGMGLSLACDIRIASERAIFSEAFARMGLVPADGSCWQLPRLIGLSHTLLLQYTGDRIDASEAYRIGLVSKVYSHEELMPECIKLAKRLSHGPTYAMSLTKYLVQKSFDMELQESLALANSAQDLAKNTQDHEEAVNAFLGKRPPRFKGR